MPDSWNSKLIKKSVVFSFWKESLTAVGYALQEEGISYIRVNGSLSSPERDINLARFQSDDSIKVILMTVLCGSVG